MSWRNPPRVRSIQVDGRRLAYHRQLRNLTQVEAARLSGYSLRLIRKAEAGGELHPDTIEVLAETYSTKNSRVFPEDLISSPSTMAMQLLDSYLRDGRQMVQRIQTILDPEMIFHYSGDENTIPFAGTHVGIDGFDRFWGLFFDTWRPANASIFKPKIVAEGGEVYAFSVDSCQAVGMPEPVSTFLVQHFEFHRGRIKKLSVMVDTQAIATYLRLAGKNQVKCPRVVG